MLCSFCSRFFLSSRKKNRRHLIFHHESRFFESHVVISNNLTCSELILTTKCHVYCFFTLDGARCVLHRTCLLKKQVIHMNSYFGFSYYYNMPYLQNLYCLYQHQKLIANGFSSLIFSTFIIL